MDKLLDTLCTLLEEEIERQENVRAVCDAQLHAVCARDLDAIAARTAAMEVLIRESLAAQARRHEILKPLVEMLELTPERQTMSGLIAVLPEPWKGRLKELQTRMRKTVEESRRAVRANARAARRSKHITDELLGVLRQEPVRSVNGYGSSGTERTRRTEEPVMIDRRG